MLNDEVRLTCRPSSRVATVVTLYVAPGSSRSDAVQLAPSVETSPASSPASEVTSTESMVPPSASIVSSWSTGTPVAPFSTLETSVNGTASGVA